MTEQQIVKNIRSKYILEVPAGTYEASNFFVLIFEVLSHRFQHLISDGKWMD